MYQALNKKDSVGDMMKSDDKKIIPFPHLRQTLVEKGMLALKNNQHEEALECFNQLLSMDSKHAEANLGKAICLAELGDLRKAAAICDKMLTEAIGDYFEVLEVYISILIQLEQYREAADLLEAVLQEETLPVSSAEFFYQMLAFSKKMADGRSERRISLSHEEIKHYSSLLAGDQIEKQLIAIKKLANKPNKAMLNELQKFLKSSSADPVLKSIVIRHLADEKINELVEIHKFSNRLVIEPAAAQNPFDHPQVEEVNERLREMLESENPSLCEMSVQLWANVVMSFYPFPLPDYDSSVLAAAIHHESCRLNGLPAAAEELASLYGIALKDLQDCLIEMEKMMPDALQLFE